MITARLIEEVFERAQVVLAGLREADPTIAARRVSFGEAGGCDVELNPDVGLEIEPDGTAWRTVFGERLGAPWRPGESMPSTWRGERS